jgi:hypothetical protein
MRQHLHLHRRTRSVTGLLWLLPPKWRPLIPIEVGRAWQLHSEHELMTICENNVTALAAKSSSFSTDRYIQIPIASQYREHRTLLPAVSSLGDYPTPAQ